MFCAVQMQAFPPSSIATIIGWERGFPNVSLIMSCLVAKDFLCSYNQGQSLTVLPQTLQGLVPAHLVPRSSHVCAPTLVFSQLSKSNTPF